MSTLKTACNGCPTVTRGLEIARDKAERHLQIRIIQGDNHIVQSRFFKIEYENVLNK